MTVRNGIAAMLAICLVSWTETHAPRAFASGKEKIPPVGEGLVLTQAQLRYCFFQQVRMESAGEVIDNTRKHEVDAINALVNDWNSRCSSYRFADPDMFAVQADTTAARKRLKAEGQALVEGWRKQRKASTYHVAASSLELRAGPGPGHGALSTLRKYQNVYSTGNAVNGWLPVTVRGKEGYVETTLVKPGSGQEARRAYCQPIAGTRPTNGEVIQASTDGKNILRIVNGLPYDAYVKLKGKSGGTKLAVFVNSESEVKLKDVPDGTYLIMFASGADFSRGCGNFTEIRDVKAFEDETVLESRTSGNSTHWTEFGITLHAVPGGNTAMADIDLNDFETD